MQLSLRFAAISSGILAVAVLGARSASADVGPIEPAREVCMGKAEGEACQLNGQSGTCHGPHPSRMYCEVAQATPPAPAPAPGPAPAPANPATAPRHKGSCSAASPGGALTSLLVGAAVLALGGRRRRGSRAR